MNRKARRAERKSGRAAINPGSAEDGATAADLMAQASRCRQQGQTQQAEILCERILAREPSHVHALNLLGLIYQAEGRHRPAAKTLAKALAADAFNAACHYNIASSYQALDRREDAALHFKRAIVLGQRQNNTEKLILQSREITAGIDRIEAQWPLPVKTDDVFGRATLDALASDIFLSCALTTVPLRSLQLERYLTLLRAALTGMAHAALIDGKAPPSGADNVALFAALAQQCFINEYVFAQSVEETRQAEELRDLLLHGSARDETIPPLLLAAVAAYFPLHDLAAAGSLAKRPWPPAVAALVRVQLHEPLEEMAIRQAIPSLTAVDDAVSLQVMHQYEENPYPRWTTSDRLEFAADAPIQADDDAPADILIAGCGSGQHALDVALQFPNAHIQAIDISRPSLAYAMRKTREAGVGNIGYAQADILKLDAIGHSFDRIESVGVLHHLADPERGWRILLSLLRPNGTMRIGLYSETARQAIVAVRGLIATRNYRPTADGIRRCRQEVFRDFAAQNWSRVVESSDFYSMSGCRDLLFNVMVHRFTIPRIKAFLDAQDLEFLGFDIDPRIIASFQARFPDRAALTDLDRWQMFEADNPQAFRYMYVFTTRRKAPLSAR